MSIGVIVPGGNADERVRREGVLSMGARRLICRGVHFTGGVFGGK